MGRQRLERTGQVCRTHDRCDARGDSARRAAFWLLPVVLFSSVMAGGAQTAAGEAATGTGAGLIHGWLL